MKTNVMITVETREGTTIYIPPTGHKGSRAEGRWRLIPKNGKGTRPVPNRLLRKRGAAHE